MKKILIFVFLFTSSFAFGQVYENGYGISINTVSENGVAEITLPCGIVMNIKAVINQNGKSRGRLTGDGVILDIPILPKAMEYDVNQGRKVPVGFYYNEPAGFTPYTATAFYVEGSMGSDNVMHYKVLQGSGQWANKPNPATWVSWYANQTQPIKNFFRKVSVLKLIRSENEQSYVIGL
jgi:hypothetical protein